MLDATIIKAVRNDNFSVHRPPSAQQSLLSDVCVYSQWLANAPDMNRRGRGGCTAAAAAPTPMLEQEVVGRDLQKLAGGPKPRSGGIPAAAPPPFTRAPMPTPAAGGCANLGPTSVGVSHLQECWRRWSDTVGIHWRDHVASTSGGGGDGNRRAGRRWPCPALFISRRISSSCS